MKKRNFAFEKINYILMAVSMFVVILGFVLMSGGESTVDGYDPSIFSARRIKVAPVVAFLGFIMMIVAIMYNPKKKEEDKEASADESLNVKK